MAKWGRNMAEVTVVYWRDIPAQVIAGRGRSAAKVQMPERFEQAIDRAAMKAGLTGTDTYLAEWRRGAPVPREGSDTEAASAVAAELDAAYGSERLRALALAGGRETA